MDWQTVELTVRLAATTTTLLMLLGLPLAWWLARGGGWARAGVQAIVGLPLVLPPTVLGFYLLVDLGPLTGLGRALIHLIGHPLAFSFTGLVVGSMLYSLPFAVQPMVAGFSAIDREFGEVASTLGASPVRVFLGITLPLAKRSVVTAAVLAFTHTVGEFGVVLMLGGNIPGATRTMSIALYDQVQDGQYADANRTALVLLLVAFAGLVALYARPRRSGGELV
ncbi:molybdate ABC transporter permease subunit [Granulicella sibirica]|uniref:Molybdenum transport system permease n=1 Tax=Granulicella sibirica TaxID=2479048 RepID=A0A4Q0T060_9BACT|nr:molybdate ABC transporter permease subunit [Granulicella sibirica]RXH56557.1 Molybdenum transport system permease protein ModB [Granulicella sibirica]